MVKSELSSSLEVKKTVIHGFDSMAFQHLVSMNIFYPLITLKLANFYLLCFKSPFLYWIFNQPKHSLI